MRFFIAILFSAFLFVSSGTAVAAPQAGTYQITYCISCTGTTFTQILSISFTNGWSISGTNKYGDAVEGAHTGDAIWAVDVPASGSIMLSSYLLMFDGNGNVMRAGIASVIPIGSKVYQLMNKAQWPDGSFNRTDTTVLDVRRVDPSEIDWENIVDDSELQLSELAELASQN